MVAKVTDMVYVLELGHIAMQGKLDEIMSSELVRKAFLGK